MLLPKKQWLLTWAYKIANLEGLKGLKIDQDKLEGGCYESY